MTEEVWVAYIMVLMKIDLTVTSEFIIICEDVIVPRTTSTCLCVKIKDTEHISREISLVCIPSLVKVTTFKPDGRPFHDLGTACFCRFMNRAKLRI